MNLYEKELEKEGIAPTRTFSLSLAMNTLHSAIARLDNKNKEIWLSKSLDERMRDFAITEQLNTRCLQKELKVNVKHTDKIDTADKYFEDIESNTIFGKICKENLDENYNKQRV